MASVLQVATIKDQGGNNNAIEIANTSANVTVNNLAGGTITSAVNFPAGHIIQVESGAHSTEGYTTSTGFASTGLTVTITPRNTSSKMFIITNTSGYNNGGSGHVGYFTIYRDSTDISGNAGLGYADIYLGSGSGHDLGTNICITELDSPTISDPPSAIIYGLYARVNNASYKAYWSMNGSKSDITVMEISG